MQKKWKFEDKLCSGCKVREETGEEILSCWYFRKEENVKPMTYDMFYCESISDRILVANSMMERLKRRKAILDTG